MLAARDLAWRAGGRTIVSGISLTVAKGEFLAIVGPNGSGKSTLLTLLAGLRPPQAGYVMLDGVELRGMPRRDVARVIALVEQQAEAGERLTARQAVELGRTPHLGPFRPWSKQDDWIVDASLASVGMTGFASRLWPSLSGGERQRLHIARALAQAPRLLILDEPTNHLDVEHQLGLLDLVRRHDLTVIAALHDLNHAAMFADRIAVLDQGRLMAIGAPAEILTTRLLAEIFHVDARVEIGADGRCFIRLLGLSRPASKESSTR